MSRLPHRMPWLLSHFSSRLHPSSRHGFLLALGCAALFSPFVQVYGKAAYTIEEGGVGVLPDFSLP